MAFENVIMTYKTVWSAWMFWMNKSVWFIQKNKFVNIKLGKYLINIQQYNFMLFKYSTIVVFTQIVVEINCH